MTNSVGQLLSYPATVPNNISGVQQVLQTITRIRLNDQVLWQALTGQTANIQASVPTGALLSSNNLSDVANSATALANLGVSSTAPTIQKFISGSGTYTTPAGVKWIRVRAVGGGGGGGSSGTGGGSGGSAGGTTTFGTSLLTANGGAEGVTNGTTGGAGGTASLGSGPIGLSLSGGNGSGGGTTSAGVGEIGGSGGNSAFGGGGSGAGGSSAGAGGDGVTNTGGGGGGAGGSGLFQGAGGGAGGYIDAIIAAPSTTYSYAVGGAGSGQTTNGGGSSGGAGGSGIIIVEEHYNF